MMALQAPLVAAIALATSSAGAGGTDCPSCEQVPCGTC
jgi:hypothetical protein